MKAYPLILNHAQTVSGSDFQANISLVCAVLLRWDEADQVWSCEPVRPNILWAGGQTIEEAIEDVRSSFTESFAAIAHGETHESFEKVMRGIVEQINTDASSAWTEALRSLRAGTQVTEERIGSLRSEKVDGDEPPCLMKIVGSVDVKTMVAYSQSPNPSPLLDAMLAHQPLAANNDLAQAA